MKQLIYKIFVCLCLLCCTFVLQAQIIPQLKNWLAQEVQPRPAFNTQAFSKKALNKKEAIAAVMMLLEDEYHQQSIFLRPAWDQKLIILGTDSLKFDYKIFGTKPSDGRSLFISMHGGGNAPSRVNDQQWKNQIRLYTPSEGVYVAPRAPTDTWNLWHESHIDSLFDQLI